MRVTEPSGTTRCSDCSLPDVVAIPRTQWDNVAWSNPGMAKHARDCFSLSDFRMDVTYIACVVFDVDYVMPDLEVCARV